MTISAAGNIGIGVTSPNYSLDVGGISYLGGGIIFASTKTIESGGTWNAYSGNGQYTFRNNLNQSMISVNGQNVGIGINTTSPSYRLDVDAKTGSAGNPIRAQGFIHSSSIDSLLGYRTANSGVVERTTAQLVVSKVFSDSCVNTSISLTAIGAASAAGATVNYGRSIQLPQIQLTARSSNSINPVTAYASSVTSTGFIANAYNLGGSAVDATIDIKVCPNGGSGY